MEWRVTSEGGYGVESDIFVVSVEFVRILCIDQ